MVECLNPGHSENEPRVLLKNILYLRFTPKVSDLSDLGAVRV